MVLGILAKKVGHTRCSSRDSKRIFPGHKSHNSPFEPTSSIYMLQYSAVCERRCSCWCFCSQQDCAGIYRM